MQIIFEKTNFCKIDGNLSINFNEYIVKNRLFDKYNETIANLFKKDLQEIALYTSIFERNTQTFIHYKTWCARQFIHENLELIDCVYTNSYFLYKELEALECSKISFINFLFFFLLTAKTKLLFFLRFIKVFYKISNNILKINLLNKNVLNNLSDYFLIQTWLSDSSFQKGQYKDLYMPGIENEINKSKNEICYLFCITNITSLTKTIKKLDQLNIKFILIEQFLSFKDLFCVFKILFNIRKLYKTKVIKDTFGNLSPIYWFDEKLDISWLISNFLNKAKKNISSEILLTNENHKLQYLFQYYIRKLNNNVKIYGYFHTSFPNNHLSLKPLKHNNKVITPIPDKLYVNSYIYRDLLKEHYDYNFDIVNIRALKQAYLNKKRNKINIHTSLLVVLPGNYTLGTQLIKIISKIDKKILVNVRQHPANPIIANHNYNDFNDNVVISNNSIIKDLDNCTHVIGSYSAVLLEAYIYGLNVGMIINKFDMSFNPFDNSNITEYFTISTEKDMDAFLMTTRKNGFDYNIFNVDKTNF